MHSENNNDLETKIPENGYMIRDDFTKDEWKYLCDEYHVPYDTDMIELHFTGAYATNS